MYSLTTFKREKVAQIALILFLLFTCWWLYEQIQRLSNPDFSSEFAHFYGVMAAFGGIFGFKIAHKWGGFKSHMGKAILFLTSGLFAQFFGQISYSAYYFIFKIDVPYPSIGDIGFFGSIIFYFLGVWYLGKVAGVKFAKGTTTNFLQAVGVPLLMLLGGYYLFLRDYVIDFSAPLTMILDLGYPLGQSIYISLTLLTYLLSRKVLGGIMKNKILFIVFALAIQFVADYVFLFQAKHGTWYPGGVNDYFYLSAYFLMSWSLIQLNTVFDDLKK